MPADTRRFQLPSDVVLQTADGEALLVKLTAEDMFALNQTGAEIVERLSQGATIEALVHALVETYDAPADAVTADVLALVGELQARGLLIEHGA